jgi:hypothetical protein
MSKGKCGVIISTFVAKTLALVCERRNCSHSFTLSLSLSQGCRGMIMMAQSDGRFVMWKKRVSVTQKISFSLTAVRQRRELASERSNENLLSSQFDCSLADSGGHEI